MFLEAMSTRLYSLRKFHRRKALSYFKIFVTTVTKLHSLVVIVTRKKHRNSGILNRKSVTSELHSQTKYYN